MMSPDRARVVGLLLLGACTPPSEQDQDADASTHSPSDTESDDDTDDTQSAGSTEETGETGEAGCDWDAYQACMGPAKQTYSACVDACTESLLSCADETCVTACWVPRIEEDWACQRAHCPEPVSDWSLCEHDCGVQALTCSAAEDCELHECSYDRYQCQWDCNVCTPLTLDFEWAGSCELVLPGPLNLLTVGYTEVHLGFQKWSIGEPDHQACGEPGIGGVFVLQADPQTPPDRLTLCDPICDEFAELGLLRFVSNPPPCE